MTENVIITSIVAGGIVLTTFIICGSVFTFYTLNNYLLWKKEIEERR